ncbi:endoribonuclease Dicer [Folsomia candida]|uniref:endoribonuclease Dicer n=1 Tax=Folsomia candida TaxID=158441 RepID=UPI000B904ADD|nr:endoribonuclease Dicer [Folsomia candida]
MDITDVQEQEVLAALAPPTEEQRRIKYEEREYQTYLYECALRKNVIICLPTGCGKTFIAVQAISHYLKEANKSNGKKIMFVANTVPLVQQQGRYLREHVGNAHSTSNEIVGIVTGNMRPEDWDGSKWKQILSEHIVFAMTDQILRQAVERGHVRWEKVSLLVLDECHNATKNHPMASLMGFYKKEYNNGKRPGTDLPRVIGLSATIVVGNRYEVDKISDDISEIESKLCSKAITYHDYKAVLRCGTQANVTHLYYTPMPEWKICDMDITITLSDLLKDIMQQLEMMEEFLIQKPAIPKNCIDQEGYTNFWKPESPIKDFVGHIKDIEDVLLEMGPFCAENAVLYKIAYIRYLAYKEKRRPKTSGFDKTSGQKIVLQWLEPQLEYVARQLKHFMFYASPTNADESFHVVNFISPKLKQLIEVLRTKRPDVAETKDFCGIVFCQKRITTQMLCYFLQDLSKYCPAQYGFLNCSFTLGTSGSNNGIIQSVALRKQTEVLENFHQKRINILAATKVLEEGLDVPSCNFICRYDPILTYPSYVQSMGRARQRGADFFTLVPKTSAKEEVNKLEQYARVSDSLSKVLINQAELPEKYYEPEDNAELNQIIPPFVPSNGPQMITAGSSTQIVYRYCEDLCTDKLSTLTPYAKWIRNDKGEFKVNVQLPPSSCVKFAESDWYPNKSIAKKAAFLEVCKKLYYAGALHPDTLLPIPRFVPTHLCDFIDNLEDTLEVPKEGKKIGSKNSTKWYNKMIPQEFLKSEKKDLSVYLIDIRVEEHYTTDEDIQSLYIFDNQHFFFGIITAADLSKVPDFLLFSRDGNFRVHLRKIEIYEGGIAMNISGDKLEKVKIFQNLLFCDDPELLHFTNLVFSDAVENPYYIAPLQRNERDNMELALRIITRMENGQSVNYREEISMADRREKLFVPENFTNALVIPSYSPSHHERQKYCMLSLDPFRSSKSAFDSPKFDSFVTYYKEKHGIVIVNKDDPLLKAKPISKQLNYLVAKYDSWKMTAEERRDGKHSSSIVFLIAELMRTHPLPATLFVQSKLLPSCMHRIFRLLLAHDIQSSVKNFLQMRDDDLTLFNKQRHEEELQNLNQTTKERAISSMNLEKMIPDLVKSCDENVIKQNSDKSKFPQDEMTLYSLKRKLLWVEIEYIHPKNIKRTDLEDPYPSDDDDEEMTEIFGHPADSLSTRTGIELIPTSQVPLTNFDAYNDAPEQPLLTSIMEAITLANGRDLQDLEKLELIGDSVLKLVVTLHIFTHFYQFHEGQLTGLRTKLISNKHLYSIGSKKNLGEFLAGGLFEPESTWLPPGKTIPPKLIKMAVKNEVNYNIFRLANRNTSKVMDDHSFISTITDEELSEIVKDRAENCKREIQELGPTHTSYTHSRLGDKSIADCVEALIGAYYLSGGISGALNLMNWIGLRAPTNEKPVNKIMYQNIKDLPRLNNVYPKESQNLIYSPLVDHLELMLEYRFKNKWIIVEAFTHPSYTHNGSTNAYQRLEFLGDAVLDFLVTHHIYNTQNKVTAGSLTDLRSALVNNVTFGSQAVRYGFHKLLLQFSPRLQESIDKFVNFQERNNHVVSGSFELLTDNDCVMAEDIDVPKPLGDIFESLAGAVFIDSGMSLDTVWKVFYRLMKNEIDIFSNKIPRQPIRQLHEEFPRGIEFTVVSEDTTAPKFVVELNIARRKKFYGCGLTKKSAKNAAAKFAMKQIHEERKRKCYMQAQF